MDKGVKWLLGIIFTVVLERLLNLIPLEKLFVADKWSWIIQNRFSIVDVALFAVSLAIVFSVIKIFKIGEKRKSRLERHLEKLSPTIEEDLGIKVSWDLSMGSDYNIDPHPYNIRVFCTKHDFPLLMTHGHCPDNECPNARISYNEHQIKNVIESKLLAEREKFLKKQ